ncbi:MAG: polysaccharide biosynthesis/export family protein [Bacteroidota bacterium]
MILVFSSCITRKQLLYLQYENEIDNLEEFPKDSILRTHDLKIREYRIQPLDILSITFESLTDEEFDFFSKINENNQIGAGNANNLALQGVVVDSEGNIEYPVTGKVNLEGLTIFEAESMLTSIAKKYLEDPVVRVRLLNFRFTVLGEVNNEQVVNSINTRITFMEAIGLAGGFGELADRSSVKVIRQSGSSSEVFYINPLEERFIESNFYYVQQNDIIIVAPNKQRTFRNYFGQNLGVFTAAVSVVTLFITILTL